MTNRVRVVESHRLRRNLAGAAAFLVSAAAFAQQQQPSLGYVYPGGGQQGSTFTVEIAGQHLTGMSELLITGGGIKAEIGRRIIIMTQQQLTGLRNNIRRWQEAEKLGETDPEMAKLAEQTKTRVLATLVSMGIDEYDEAAIREYSRIALDPKRQHSASIAEVVTCTLTIAPNANLGDREIRMRSARGLTNPIRFVVGKIPEIREEEPNDRAPESALDVTMPFVINGQVMPGDVDRFRFKATKGQKIVASVLARALNPYLADTVPGWFQATLALHDTAGKELAFVDDFRFDPDPVLACEIPEDGDYIFTINDSIYRGREDFVYRITVGELPFLSGVFPMGGRAGAQTTVNVYGWNLNRDTLTLVPGGTPPTVRPIALTAGDHVSNWVLFSTENLNETTEMEPNDEARIAQRTDVPILINGRISRPGDRDVFRFNGRQGQRIVAEVTARRLGSPLDSVLRLFDAQGQVLAYNDDFDDRGSGLVMHQADSRILHTLPADGVYYLQLSDTQNNGDDTYAYRLSIGPPRPGFELRATPSSLNVRAGDPVTMKVFALRRDGFNGPIDLVFKNPPKRFVASGARIPAGQENVRFTVMLPHDAEEKSYQLKIEGVAKIGGKDVRVDAIPADDMMQAFLYRHLVTSDAMLLTVLKRAGRSGSEPATVKAPAPLQIPAGGKALIYVEVPGRSAKGTEFADFEISEPPKGISAGQITYEGHNYIYEVLAAADAPVGMADNLIIEIHGARFVKTGEKPVRQGILGLLPAVPFEVVKP